MGREGKVASPALRGNANPRLLRHKLVYTTLSKWPNTQSNQNCIPAGRRRGPRRRADSPPRPSSGRPPGAPYGPAGRGRPRRLPWQLSVSAWQRAGHARVNRPRRGRAGATGRPGGRAGAPGAKAPAAPTRTGQRASPAHPRGMRAYQTGTSPQPGGCTSLTPDAGLSQRAQAVSRRSMPSRAVAGGMDRKAEEGDDSGATDDPGAPSETRQRFRRGGTSTAPRDARPSCAQQAGDLRDRPSPGRERAGAAVRRWRRRRRRGRARR